MRMKLLFKCFMKKTEHQRLIHTCGFTEQEEKGQSVCYLTINPLALPNIPSNTCKDSKGNCMWMVIRDIKGCLGLRSQVVGPMPGGNLTKHKNRHLKNLGGN